MNHPRFQIGKVRLPAELDELGLKLGALPDPTRRELMRLYQGVVESFRVRSRVTRVAREALERTRLEMTCLQFDLELTRRENQSLRERMEEG